MFILADVISGKCSFRKRNVQENFFLLGVRIPLNSTCVLERIIVFFVDSCDGNDCNCNCDLNTNSETFDKGFLTDKNMLPITEL